MTSDSSNGNSFASSIYGTGYEAYRAFDNNENTFWSSVNSVSNPYIQYEFANNESKTVDSFSLQTRLDAATYMPTSVTLLYNKNGSWVEAGVFAPVQNLLEQTFNLATSVTSNAFRILINGTGTYAFSKVQLYCNKLEEVKFHFDYKDGKYGFNIDPKRGADTFIPFKRTETDSGSVSFNIGSNGASATQHVNFNKTFSKTPTVGITNPWTYFSVNTIKNVSTTGFDIEGKNNGSATYTFNWIAIVAD